MGRRLLAIAWALLSLAPPAHAQPPWLRRYEQRTARYTSQQPHWAGPVFATVPMLVQVWRQDALHQEAGGTHLWNAGVGKGLQLVPLPPAGVHGNRAALHQALQLWCRRLRRRLRVRESAPGCPAGGPWHYILSALLNSTLPTGEGSNGAPSATLTPQLVGGKGWGRFDQVVSLAAFLPVRNAASNGRVLVANTALQYHAARYAWPEIETSTTTWFGSPRDGQVQTLIGPGLIVGRLPYTEHERDRRRGISFGAGYLVAVTGTRAYNHVFQITTRLHF